MELPITVTMTTTHRCTQVEGSGKMVCFSSSSSLLPPLLLWWWCHIVSLLSGLQIRKFPTSNTYMDDPFHLSLTGRDQPIYSNTSVLEHMVRSPEPRISVLLHLHFGSFTSVENVNVNTDECLSWLQLHSSQDSVGCSSVSSRDSVTYSNTVFTTQSESQLRREPGHWNTPELRKWKLLRRDKTPDCIKTL